MEFIDLDALSDEEAASILEKAPPCEICGLCDYLVLGASMGELLILCFMCHLDIDPDPSLPV